jgi:hypothetical protein
MAIEKKPARRTKAASGAERSLEEFRQSHKQMELFFLRDKSDRDYSHLVELYDAIPKYHWGRTERTNGKFLQSLEREFVYQGNKYTVLISPARLVKLKDGKVVEEKEFYPGPREEIIEDALRKLACDGAGLMLADDQGEEAGVVFSLYGLQKELARMGHKLNIPDIKDGIMVCAKSHLEVRSADGKDLLMSPIFSTVGLSTREEWIERGKDAKAFVRFNPLVSRSIKNRTFRQFNYLLSMKYRYALARWIHKRISYHFRQASRLETYNILLTSVIRDSGVTRYEKISNNNRDVKKGLDELIEKEVLSQYEDQVIYEDGRRNRIADVKYILYPHPSFIAEMRRFNAKASSLLEGPA